MDENIVAVHMIESDDGTYTTFEVIKQEKDDISDDCVVIERNGDHNSDTAITDDIVEQVMIDDEKEAEDESKRENTSMDDRMIDEKLHQTSGEDVIIAEAVYVTQYRCKFCAKLYETIDKVKNHYIQAHENNVDDNKRVLRAPQNSVSHLESEKRVTELNSDLKTKTKDITKSRVNSNARITETSLKRKLEFIPTPIPSRDTYRCVWPQCDYVARHEINLKEHLKSHSRTQHTGQQLVVKSKPTHTHSTDEKPYRCEWKGCRLRFSQKNNVKVHMRTHTGDKPYHCDWPDCDRKFAVKSNLDEHYKVLHSRVF